MNAATKMRDYRLRRADGKICLVVEIHEIALIERLVQAGFLDRSDEEDRVALAKALERVITAWVGEVTSNDMDF